MKKIIVIVDYGLGNIRSAKQSIKQAVNYKRLNAEVNISNNPNDIKNATHIVLPGQGAFLTCMSGLLKIPGIVEELSEGVLHKKKPFLGICVGMQLLANTSYENGKHNGLGWIEGEIVKLPQNNLKLPHMGWNEIIVKNKTNQLIKNQKKNNFYFVHSYYFQCRHKENEVATTNYGLNFTSIVCKENIYGVQFHPEKSSYQGLEILKNFIDQ